MVLCGITLKKLCYFTSLAVLIFPLGSGSREPTDDQGRACLCMSVFYFRLLSHMQPVISLVFTCLSYKLSCAGYLYQHFQTDLA